MCGKEGVSESGAAGRAAGRGRAGRRGFGGFRRAGLCEAGEAEALELDAHHGLKLLRREGLVRPAQRAVLRNGGEVRRREVDARLELLRRKTPGEGGGEGWKGTAGSDGVRVLRERETVGVGWAVGKWENGGKKELTPPRGGSSGGPRRKTPRTRTYPLLERRGVMGVGGRVGG